MDSMDSKGVLKEELKQDFIEVTCGNIQGVLHMDKFRCPGIHSQCVEFEGQLITPKKFTILGEKQSLKDWKKALRINRIPVREIMDKGFLDFSNHDQTCTGRCLGRAPATPKDMSPLLDTQQKSVTMSSVMSSPLVLAGPLVGEAMTINEHTYCHLPNDGEDMLTADETDDNVDALQGSVQKRPVVYVVGNAIADSPAVHIKKEKVDVDDSPSVVPLEAAVGENQGRASLEELVRLADTQDVYSDLPLEDKLEDSQKFWEGIIGLGLLEDFIEEIKLALDIVRSRMLRSRDLMLRESKKLSNVVNELGLFRMLQRRMIELQQETNREQNKLKLEMTELKRKWAETQKRKTTLDKKGRLFEQVSLSGRIKRDEDRDTASPLSMGSNHGNPPIPRIINNNNNSLSNRASTGNLIAKCQLNFNKVESARSSLNISLGTQTPLVTLGFGEAESTNSSSNGSTEFEERATKRVKLSFDGSIEAEKGSTPTAEGSAKHAVKRKNVSDEGGGKVVRVAPLDNSSHGDEVYTITLATSDDDDDDIDLSNEAKILNERQRELDVDEEESMETNEDVTMVTVDETGSISRDLSRSATPQSKCTDNADCVDQLTNEKQEEKKAKSEGENKQNADQVNTDKKADEDDLETMCVPLGERKPANILSSSKGENKTKSSTSQIENGQADVETSEDVGMVTVDETGSVSQDLSRRATPQTESESTDNTDCVDQFTSENEEETGIKSQGGNDEQEDGEQKVEETNLSSMSVPSSKSKPANDPSSSKSENETESFTSQTENGQTDDENMEGISESGQTGNESECENLAEGSEPNSDIALTDSKNVEGTNDSNSQTKNKQTDDEDVKNLSKNGEEEEKRCTPMRESRRKPKKKIYHMLKK